MNTLILVCAFVVVFVLGAFCGVRGVLWMLTLGPRHSPNTYEEVRAAMKKGGGA